MVEAPTQEDLMEEMLDCVQTNSDNSWRHGTYEADVYHRKEDDTYWMVCYQLSGDGEYHGIRENDFTVQQVKPKEVTAIEYVNV